MNAAARFVLGCALVVLFAAAAAAMLAHFTR